MTITPKVYNFPTFAISKQLFYVPGAMTEGGYTSGGARITLPEPGGFSMLDLEPALQVNEWNYPLSSWLMSKTNGQILRIRLAPTPQVSTAKFTRNQAGVPWDNNILWNNLQNWDGDIAVTFLTGAVEGSNAITIDVTAIGQLLQPGHVIGHDDITYMIDEIEYSGNVAFVKIFLGFRKAIAANDICFLRPYFTGQIVNASDFRSTYDAEMAGHIKLGKMTLSEVIL